MCLSVVSIETTPDKHQEALKRPEIIIIHPRSICQHHKTTTKGAGIFMSKNKKPKNKKPKITKADGDIYEEYLYFKLMIIKDSLEHITKELLKIKAPDILETYRKNGITDGEFLMDMVEGIAEEDNMMEDGGRG